MMILKLYVAATILLLSAVSLKGEPSKLELSVYAMLFMPMAAYLALTW